MQFDVMQNAWGDGCAATTWNFFYTWTSVEKDKIVNKIIKAEAHENEVEQIDVIASVKTLGYKS